MIKDLERFTPDMEGRLAHEHRHRYAFLREFVAQKYVLDVACGEGYGANMLADTAASVIGLDLNADIISQAAIRYTRHDRVFFTVGNCATLPLRAESFDAVISFETIEHIHDSASFLCEVARVLRKTGTFIVSTPNKEEYSDGDGKKNPFHVKEFDRLEFWRVLQQHFSYIELYGQRFYAPSVIATLALKEIQPRQRWSSYECLVRGARDGSRVTSSTLEVDRPSYLIAVCSNVQASLPVFAPSLYFDECDDLWLHTESILKWASHLHEQDEQLRKHLAKSQRRLRGWNALYANAAKAKAEQKTLEEELSGLNEALVTADTARIYAEGRLQQKTNELVASEQATAAGKEELNQLQNILQEHVKAASLAQDEASRTISDLQSQLTVLRREVSVALAQKEAQTKKAEGISSALNATIASRVEHERKCKERSAAFDLALDSLKHKHSINVLRNRIKEELYTAHQSVRQKSGRVPFGLEFHQSQLRPRIPFRSTLRRTTWSHRRQISRSNLFDAQWYLDNNPDVVSHNFNPRQHFFLYGVFEDRDPHPLFSSGWYRSWNLDKLKGLPPFIHFLQHRFEGAQHFHPLFDVEFYFRENKHVSTDDPLGHFFAKGWRDGLSPHPLIWIERLREQLNCELSVNVFEAYLTNCEFYHASPHPLFDSALYLAENQDVADKKLNPLLHYCTLGWREGRDPHPLFANDWYLNRYPDVSATGRSPLEHFVSHGGFEGRLPHPLFDTNYYLDRYQDARITAFDALTHYVLVGADGDREVTQQISVSEMRGSSGKELGKKEYPISTFMRSAAGRISFPRGAVATGPILWPPEVDTGYRVPPKLEDHIIDRYGAKVASLYNYLMFVLDKNADDPGEFHRSPEFRLLLARLIELADYAPRTKDIDASIVVPVYNNCIYTLTCLLSILENRTNIRYEIIIGDDCSNDGTWDVFSKVGGCIRVMRHERNHGFLTNCNISATIARGQVIIILNNDTLTLPGWLDELVGPILRDKLVGLTGSKLLNGDGTLQEAGGILWSDGSAWNFGRNSNPSLPEFNYKKEVDYISAASIAVRREAWKMLGGFDPFFAPAYCEDSDLALRIRRAGLRVVYVPHSETVHHEGKSHGSDLTAGLKKYQVLNQQKLLERWRPTLERDQFRNGDSVFLARDRSRNRTHILIVDHYIPQWDRDAGSRTMFHFIRLFVLAGFQVVFWPDNLNEDREYCKQLQNIGVEVIYSAAYLNKFEMFMSANGQHFDYALLSRPHVAIKFYNVIKQESRAIIIYYGHDIHFHRLQAEQAVSGRNLERAIEAARDEELDNWRRADVVLYPSADESEHVANLVPGCKAATVPMLGYVQAELAQMRINLSGFDSRNVDELLYVGGSHPPNLDALIWFVSAVMPSILRVRPQTRLQIVGSAGNSEVARLRSESVIIRGRLNDFELNQLYATAGIAVIPLRFGAGVKGKTIEALVNAIPVVSTSVGMQGICPQERICFVADGAEAFAEAVLAAQTQRTVARENVVRGAAFIETNYTINALGGALAPFMPLLGELISNGGMSDDKVT
jgi:GT2 family glycosyltransferase/ubiquinone/menaquinone biosynthesis C-methylase UbiE